MCSQKSFTSRRESYLSLISKDLSSCLKAAFPKMSALDLQNSLEKAIVQPAADLAHRLQTATNIFWLKWPLKTASSRLEVYECLDLANGGRVLDLSGTSPSSLCRQNIKYLFDIAPGLFVERVEGNKKAALKCLCRPRVLIHSLESQVAYRSNMMTWLFEAASC